MSTPTHVSDGPSLLPCRTPSQANRSTCTAASPPSRTVPVTHVATPADQCRGPSPCRESWPAQPASCTQPACVGLHICRSTKGRHKSQQRFWIYESPMFRRSGGLRPSAVARWTEWLRRMSRTQSQLTPPSLYTPVRRHDDCAEQRPVPLPRSPGQHVALRTGQDCK